MGNSIVECMFLLHFNSTVANHILKSTLDPVTHRIAYLHSIPIFVGYEINLII